jgi:glyoxylase-like metal-dependent hydrolase (beta-lactamase superfamily II)
MDVEAQIKELKARKQREREALHYPLVPPNADGTLVRICDGIYWARLPIPMGLDHINVYLLEDDDGWYLLDTGLNTAKNQQLWQSITENHCATKPVKGVICTHFHYDHSGLASWLSQYFEVPLYMTHGEFYMLESMSNGVSHLGNQQQRLFYQKAGVPDDKMDAMFDACRNDPFMEHRPRQFTRLRGGEGFKIGKRNWHILIGEGHSPEHACFYSEANVDEPAILIVGDQLLPEISANILITDREPNANPLKLLLNSQDAFNALDANTLVLPAHGPIYKNMHIRIDQFKQHHNRHLAVLTELASEQAFTPWQAMLTLFTRPLSPMDQVLALGETLAHLNYLIFDGQLQKQYQANECVDLYKTNT